MYMILEKPKKFSFHIPWFIIAQEENLPPEAGKHRLISGKDDAAWIVWPCAVSGFSIKDHSMKNECCNLLPQKGKY